VTAAELQSLIERRGVHDVFGASGEGYGIEQSPRELAAFLARMGELGVSSVLEIGTGYRAGLARFLAHDMGWRVTTVDVQGYDHDMAGITFITDCIPGFEYPAFQERFDLVFIDGDHSYTAVHFDHSYYEKFATKAIAFHDIAGLRDCEGTRDYWREIAYDDDGSLRAGYHEAIDADNPAGIGWLEL
jgi:hypothetical protein